MTQETAKFKVGDIVRPRKGLTKAYWDSVCLGDAAGISAPHLHAYIVTNVFLNSHHGFQYTLGKCGDTGPLAQCWLTEPGLEIDHERQREQLTQSLADHASYYQAITGE